MTFRCSENYRKNSNKTIYYKMAALDSQSVIVLKEGLYTDGFLRMKMDGLERLLLSGLI